MKKTEIQTSSVSFFAWDCGSSTLWKPLSCTGMNLDRYQMSAVFLSRRKQIQSSCPYRKFIQTLIGHEDNTNSQGKKYCQMVNDMVFMKCGLSIDHENQNIFFKWIKQETEDESTYSLNLVSKFSYKVHCKAGILASKYDSECPWYRRLWDFASPQIPCQFIKFGFPLSTSKNYSGKKTDPRDWGSVQPLSIPSWSSICHLYWYSPVSLTCLTFFGVVNVLAYSLLSK